MYKYKNKPKRIYLENEFYFVTIKTFYNKLVFHDNKNSEIFGQALMFLKNRGDFELSAGVLLPDHFHLLLMPVKKNISEIMHDLKSYTANRINYLRGRDASLGMNGGNNYSRRSTKIRRGTEASPLVEGMNDGGDNIQTLKNPPRRGVSASSFVKIWQRSFYYHIITNDWDFDNHYNYIIWNPEKHGYITDSRNWPWLWFDY